MTADSGAGLDVWANIGVQLGRVAGLLEADRRDRILAYQNMHTAPLTAPPLPLTAAVNGSGTLDVPDLLGPKKGYCWAIHWVAAASFTVGTVNVYIGPQGDQNLRFVFPSAGVWEPPRTSTILNHGDRLVFVATGITGAVTISGQVTEMTADQLPSFLR